MNLDTEATSTPPPPFENSAKAVWTITCAVMILLLQVGIAFFDAGKVRYKNL